MPDHSEVGLIPRPPASDVPPGRNCVRPDCGRPIERRLCEAMPPPGDRADRRWDLCADCWADFLTWIALPEARLGL